MRLAIIHTLRGRRYAEYIRSFVDADIKVDVLSWLECLDRINRGQLPEWDLVHVRFGGLGISLHVIKTLELEGYRLVNSSFCVEHTTNKFLGVKLAERAGVQVPRTWLVDPRFEPPDVKMPVVAKPLMSTSGKDVHFILTNGDLRSLSFAEPYLLQEVVDFTRLIRIVVVGDRVVDAACDYPVKRWQAKVCMNPHVKAVEVSPEIEEFAMRMREASGGEVIVVDVFETEDGLVFNEVNNACNLYPMQQATGVNHAKIIADYLSDRLRGG